MPARIDAHQHFWRFDAADFPWIDPAGPLSTDRLPRDLKPEMDRRSIDGCLAVQARQSVEETEWLVNLALSHRWILGVVGWIDLRADDIERRLDAWAGDSLLVGYRHIVQDEPSDDFLLDPAFICGVGAVLSRGLSYDILIVPRQAHSVRRFADLVGEGRLILDHGAKPPIAASGWQPWADAITDMARVPTLYCKISGLVTEADHHAWVPTDIVRYLDHLLGCFGPERLIFGSDWPVCNLAATYGRVHDLTAEWVDRSCPAHASAVFGGNAARAYAISAAR